MFNLLGEYPRAPVAISPLRRFRPHLRDAILMGTAICGTFAVSGHAVAQTGAQIGAQTGAPTAAPTQVTPKKTTPEKHAARDTSVPQKQAGPERLTVYGLLTPNEAALTEQKNAIGVSSVLSRTRIEQAPQTNLADILVRLPGVSAYSDMTNGQAATGENQYITVRGLNASYDAYTLDGERIAPSDPTTRAISFDMLAPYGISSVKIDKTPGADQDGDAIGGAIDIRIPSAFDFSEPFVKLSTEGQIAEQATRVGTASDGGNVEVEAARRFGHDGQFGVYLSGYYEQKNVTALAASPNTSYAPTLESEANLPLNEASSLSNSQIKYDAWTTNLVRYGGNLSLDYQGDNQTLYLRSTVGQYNTTTDDNQASLRSIGAGYDAQGIYDTPQGLRGQYFETDDSNQFLATQKLGGTTKAGPWDFDYDAFNSYSVLAEPNQVELSAYPAGTIPGPFTFHFENTVLPSETGPANGLAQLKDENEDRVWKTQGRDAQSIADMFGLHGDATYKVDDSLLDFVKFGFKVSDTDRESWEHPYFHDDNNFVVDGPFFGGQEYSYNEGHGPEVGAAPGRQVNAFLKELGEFRLISRSYVESLTVPYKYQNDPNGAGDYTKDDYDSNSSLGTEQVYAGYVMAALHAGPVQIVPGFRYEQTEFAGKHYEVNGDDTTGEYVGVHQSYGEPLPFLNLNWRPTNESVLRFAVRRSFSRPAYGLINGSTTVSTDSMTGAITGVSEPNPNLHPATSTDIDASGELYDHHGGVVSANLYYKQISDFIFTSVSDRDNSSTLGGLAPTGSFQNGATEYSMPENGGGASLEGIELDADQRVWFLPQWARGLGVETNMTLQHSRANSRITGHPDTELPEAPELLYNVGAYYGIGGFRTDLNFHYAGTQLFLLNSAEPDFYLQPTQELDLTMKYNFLGRLTASFAVQNLLDTPAFWETEGKGRAYLAYDSSANGAYVKVGRIFLFGLKAEL